MKVCVLSSGSKGNSTLVITDKVKILIDLGTTTSYVEAALNNLNVDVKEISHILITHSHVDHIKGLKVPGYGPSCTRKMQDNDKRIKSIYKKI